MKRKKELFYSVKNNNITVSCATVANLGLISLKSVYYFKINIKREGFPLLKTSLLKEV